MTDFYLDKDTLRDKKVQLENLIIQRNRKQKENEGTISWDDGPDGFHNLNDIAALDSLIAGVQWDIQNAELIEYNATNPEIVEIGDYVLVQFAGDIEAIQIRIVCPTASDPSKGYVGSTTLLAESILGCKAGDTVTYWSDEKKREVTVLKVKVQ